MPLAISQSTQFEINKLVINSKYGPIDVSAIFEELNIFDSVFVPCMSGNILLKDSVGLSNRLMFDGSEFIDIDIVKDKNAPETNLKKTFRIYKQSNRTNVNQNSEVYILHFVSEEMIYSEQQKISQSYTGQYSNIASSVLIDYLKVPKNKIGFFESSKGIHSVVVPLLSPIDTMNWLVKRSVSENDTADYLFFENKLGFNFVSLNKLFLEQSLFTINFSTKNLTTEIATEFLGVREYNIDTSFDVLASTRNGYYSNRFVGFDILTRTLVETNLGHGNHYKGKHLNDSANIFISKNREGRDASYMPFSKVSLYPFQLYRNLQGYIKQNDTNKSLLIDETHKYIPQRKAILNNLLQRKMTVSLPGNFYISSGFILDVDAHSFSLVSDVTEENDKSVSGKYLIVSTRHMINPTKHQTYCELATDSIKTGILPATDSFLDRSKYK
jgi:hypothetical protein